MNLDANQRRQAKTQRDNAHATVNARIPETYQWLLVPMQLKPQDPASWQAFRLQGQEALAVRASRKLKNDELLVSKLAATRLRLELDNVPLWRGEHVPVKQLAKDFARYLYLPRLRSVQVLVEAIQDGVALLSWQQHSFAFADSYDETTKRRNGIAACDIRHFASPFRTMTRLAWLSNRTPRSSSSRRSKPRRLRPSPAANRRSPAQPRPAEASRRPNQGSRPPRPNRSGSMGQ